MEAIAELIKFYSLERKDWRLPVLYLLWKADGRPRRHWTFHVRVR